MIEFVAFAGAFVPPLVMEAVQSSFLKIASDFPGSMLRELSEGVALDRKLRGAPAASFGGSYIPSINTKSPTSRGGVIPTNQNLLKFVCLSRLLFPVYSSALAPPNSEVRQ